MIGIRIFACEECPDCKKVMIILNDAQLADGVEMEYIDALEEDTQDLCDEHNVDMLPHVQYIDTDGKVTKELIGLKEFITDLAEGMK